MKNRMTVKIDGLDYTIVADELTDYIQKTAALVDTNILEVKTGSGMSSLSAVVLAAMNIADMYYKSQQSYENMRSQIREYAEENSALRQELNKLKKG